jgi:tRNA threonylcarbamoyladenosine biosynthesis protein TsaE
MIFESFSEKDTFALGRQMGEQAKAGEIYLLHGDLGVGKTVFTKGFAAGLGIAEPVTSPTFTLIQEYEQGRIPFYHFDVYRISDVEEMYDIGYEGYFFGEGVCLIEWASLIREIIPEDAKSITIRKDLEKGFDYRMIELDWK